MRTSIEAVARAWRRTGPALGLTLLATGCGSNDGQLPLHPTRGQVVIDGQPAAGVQVRLHPLDRANDPNAPQPFAATGADGAFRLGTYTKDDGAPVGRYRATLFWPDRPPGPSAPMDRLDGQYNRPAQSGLEVTIAEGHNELKPFDIQTPPKRTTTRPRTSRPARRDVDALGDPPTQSPMNHLRTSP